MNPDAERRLIRVGAAVMLVLSGGAQLAAGVLWLASARWRA